MSHNRRKSSSNAIEIGWLARLGMVALFAAVIGVSFVMIKNRLHDYGEMQLALERQLKELREKNQALDAQIAKWSSREMIDRHIEPGFIDMRPIEDQRIVRLHFDSAPGRADELRVVSNQFDQR